MMPRSKGHHGFIPVKRKPERNDKVSSSIKYDREDYDFSADLNSTALM